MASPLHYLLDANIFIEATRRYYAFDLAPGFWNALVWQESQGRIASIDKVKLELERGADALMTWATTAMPASCFHATDQDHVIAEFGQMVAWVQAQNQFHPDAKADFANGTDAWLIAFAKASNFVLVTHEVLAPDARNRVPIPNVCRAFGVDYVDTFEMLRRLNVQLFWAPPS